MLLIFGVTSCNNAEKESFNQEIIVNLENVTRSDIKLLLVNNSDTSSLLLSPNSTFELVGLKENWNSFGHVIKNKLDYLSYQKADSSPVVLINNIDDVYLSDIDILQKAKGDFTYSNGTGKFSRVVINYPLK